ncbi:MAG: hypothetical protein GWO04_43205, partial [Actinobacteria bacterium]|nr:hypothetical protein [Actinomycetota bacterium]NIS36330.1 hypothetical protein [Actinomycetota bacterium]
ITGEGSGVAPHDLRIAAWSQLNLPVTPTCATLVYQAASDPELWFGASDGNVYRLQDESAVTYANGASTSAITATFETAPLPLGASAVDAGAARAGRGEPRYIEVESESSTGITWAVVVTILSGPEGKTLGTSSFNLTCPSGNSQVAIPIPPAGVMGNHFRVKLTNAS